MEQLWHHIINERLCAPTGEHPILMTESALGRKAEREKSTEIMFEKFGVPAFFLIVSAVLSLSISTPRKVTGIVLDSGYGVTRAVPIFENCALRHAVSLVDFAGQGLTDLLEKELTQKMGQRADVLASLKEVVSDIKETTCYVDQEIPLAEQEPSTDETAFKLPDGQIIMIGKER